MQVCLMNIRHVEILKICRDASRGVPPDPFPNSEVKPTHADGTAALSCGRVGHCRHPTKGESRSQKGRLSSFFSISLWTALGLPWSVCPLSQEHRRRSHVPFHFCLSCSFTPPRCFLRRAGCGSKPLHFVETVVLEEGEACDDGNENNTDECTTGCDQARCGDGIKRNDLEITEAGYEACDDGNDLDADGCLK